LQHTKEGILQVRAIANDRCQQGMTDFGPWVDADSHGDGSQAANTFADGGDERKTECALSSGPPK